MESITLTIERKSSNLEFLKKRVDAEYESLRSVEEKKYQPLLMEAEKKLNDAKQVEKNNEEQFKSFLRILVVAGILLIGCLIAAGVMKVIAVKEVIKWIFRTLLICAATGAVSYGVFQLIKRNNFVLRRCKQEYDKVNSEYTSILKKHKADRDCKIANLEKDYRELTAKVLNLANNLCSNGQSVPQMAMFFAKVVNQAFKFEDSRPHIKVMHTKLLLGVKASGIAYRFKHKKTDKKDGKEKIDYWEEWYDFIVEGFNPLSEQVQYEAFAEAISRYLGKLYLNKFSLGQVKIERDDNYITIYFDKMNDKHLPPKDPMKF